MKCLRFAYCLGILFLSGVMSGLSAQEPSSGLLKQIHNGKELIYHFRLDSALTVFRSIQDEFPQFPHGYFYEAYINTILFSQDKTNQTLDSLLKVTVDRSINVSKKYKDRTSESPDALFYTAVSYGILGVYHVINRSYLKAYFHGRRAINYLEEVIKKDDTYYDAYIGLGIFHYYVDLLPGLVKFFAGLLGLHGDKDQGKQEIFLTAQHGQYFKLEAQFIYAVIRFFFEGAKENALNSLLSLKEKYPTNPALSLIIGYFYRRGGEIGKAMQYFSEVTDEYTDTLPQITVMKYYNFAVCYFRLNQFQKTEEHLNKIIYQHVRKSPYYQAAVAYYKGLLADLRFERNKAEYYYGMITENKHTKYWFNVSRMHRKYEMDSLLYHYVVAENNVFTSQLETAQLQIKQLDEAYRARGSANYPYLILLIDDLKGLIAFKRGKFEQAAAIYEKFIDDVADMDDDFRKAWIYIHYARVLRELEKWEYTAEILEKASQTDDEYTKLIIEREEYILKTRQKS